MREHALEDLSTINFSCRHVLTLRSKKPFDDSNFHCDICRLKDRLGLFQTFPIDVRSNLYIHKVRRMQINICKK